MRTLLAHVLVAGLSATVGCATSSPTTQRGVTLDGTYRLHKVSFLGRVAHPDDGDDLEMVLKGETITYTGKGWNKTDPVTITTDPLKEPPTIDLVFTGDGGEKIQRGIYKLEGGELTIATGRAGGEENRPKDFTPQADVMIEVYKRK